MATRSNWLAYVFLAGVAAAGCGAALMWRQRTESLPELATGVFLTPRRAVPDLNLIDERGRSFTNASLAGHWSLLFFGYTNCPDVCPATLATLAAVDKRIGTTSASLRPQVVFVSVDAARDTPQRLAAYVPYFDSTFRGVTAADQPSIEAMAAKLGVAVSIRQEPGGGYSVDHSAAIFVIDPEGRIAAILTGPYTTAGIVADLEQITAVRS
jgi:protein SCO1/2